MTANQTGTWNGERKPWLESWNQMALYILGDEQPLVHEFSTSQDGGKIRYRILPHGIYDASTANRFGLEQAPSLVHLAANSNAIAKPVVSIGGSVQ
jgi:hypothetical protein